MVFCKIFGISDPDPAKKVQIRIANTTGNILANKNLLTYRSLFS
jgi:hypothetical protein